MQGTSNPINFHKSCQPDCYLHVEIGKILHRVLHCICFKERSHMKDRVQIAFLLMYTMYIVFFFYCSATFSELVPSKCFRIIIPRSLQLGLPLSVRRIVRTALRTGKHQLPKLLSSLIMIQFEPRERKILIFTISY